MAIGDYLGVSTMACIGGTNFSNGQPDDIGGRGYCAPGYAGPLCSLCEEGRYLDQGMLSNAARLVLVFI